MVEWPTREEYSHDDDDKGDRDHSHRNIDAFLVRTQTALRAQC